MANPTLSAIMWGLALLVSALAILSFARGLTHMWRTVSAGTPDPGRLRPVGKRAWGVVSAALTHREFKGRPWIKAAHWLVMVSFPILFLTLVTGYAQLRVQTFTLPFLGHFAPWEWLTEVFAWGGLAGIILLMSVRQHAGRGTAAEAALSNDDPDGAAAAADPNGTPPSSLTKPHPRDSSPRGLASRFLGSTRWQALFVEWVILIVCACVVALRGLEYALFSVTPGLEAHASALHFPLTAWLGALFVAAASSSAASLANAIVLVSALKVITSMTWLTVVGIQTGMGVAWHRFVAILNLYTRRNADGTKSLGPADHMLIDGKPVTSEDDFDDLPEDTVLGVGTVDDFSWKARLDLYSCTECGRCQELCPAWNTQKPLSPKLLIMGLRDHMESASNVQIVEQEEGHQKLEDGEVLLDKGVPASPHSFDLVSALSLSGATGPEGVSAVTAPLVPEVVSEEVLWDCTNCGACVEQCPVDIEHIDHILDLRRHQVLMEGAFPRELGRAFRGMESKANPYNQAARKRMDWAKKLDFDIPVVGEDIEDASQVDYLFWVGCAGAYDDTAKKTSAAVAELLHTAGVSFAVLGSGESCTGDPARRAGNEALFQMLAAQAIDTLTEAKPQKIVVSCAHCFNTIAGEYPELGGHFDVVHHTQLLNRLVRDGLLTPVPPTASTASAASASEDATDEAGAGTAGTAPSVGTPLKVTYHDACFLGRHNRIYEPPRELVGSLPNVELVEMPRNRDRAMCCGAGGAHAWFEETRGTRIADARIVEAASTGADVVATACPFCSQMLGSASGTSAGFVSSDATSRGSSSAEGPTASPSGKLPEVRDVAVMLLESVKRGQ